MDENRVTYFAQTDARNKRISFGIKAKDRSRHVYVIGKTGMGKSTLLENMAVQDIKNGEGMAFIDPHGKTADLLLEYVPEERIKDVLYFAPFDVENPISFNVLENVDPDKRHLVVSGLMSTFKKIWQDAWSARMEYILTNTLLALLEYPDSTLLGVNRMLSDKAYRTLVVNNIKDPSVKAFWTEEFAKYTERMAAEAVPAIQNKIGQFTANPLIRNMIGQPKSTFNIREMMDKKKILIVNLSKGRIGESNANLLGGMLITKIYLAAMSRADMPDQVVKKLPSFYLFVDEFQNFANESFADILSEARKYKLSLTIAHQYIEQMEEEVRAAVFGNVGTMITFRIGAFDAEVLEKEFAPQFTAEDLVNLGFAQIYLKLMIDGISSSPFSAVTLPPIEHPAKSYVNEAITSSRVQFSQPRATVETSIADWHAPMVAAPGVKIQPAGTFAASRAAAAPSTPTSRVADRQHVKESIREVVELVKAKAAPSTPRTVARSPAPTPAPALAPEMPKPISLSALAPKVDSKSEPRPEIAKDSKPQPKPAASSQPTMPRPSTTNNKKIQTPQNVNALKDALASVLGDMKKASLTPPSATSPAPAVAPAPSAAAASISSAQPAKKPVSENPTSKQPREIEADEVPEGVLRDLLSTPKRGKV